MWLKKTFWYLLYLLKYLIFGTIIACIIAIFFPPAGLIVGGLFLIGSFGAAYNDLKEKILPEIEYKHREKEYKQLEKKFNKVKDEFDGFDEMMRTVQRNI